MFQTIAIIQQIRILSIKSSINLDNPVSYSQNRIRVTYQAKVMDYTEHGMFWKNSAHVMYTSNPDINDASTLTTDDLHTYVDTITPPDTSEPPLEEVPQTGDDSHLGLRFSLMLLSLFWMITAMIIAKRKVR